MTTHAPPSTSSNDAPTQTSGYKRRRLSSQKNKEELAYTASTIHKRAFIQGNRREHALPIGCGVDTCTVKLVTAAEYDDDRWSSGSSDEDGGRQLQSNQLQQGQGQQEEDCKCKDETGESSSSNNSNMNDAAVIEMQLYANLVTSTRQSYYTNDLDLALATKSTSKRRPTATASNTTATTNGNLRSSSPNSSEGNSTWSPSLLEDTTTTLNDFKANHTKKNIDNDNRSDGQSSNMGNYGWYSSDDSDSSSSSDDDDDDNDENEFNKYEENEEILRQQCDLGHQVQEQQRGDDKVNSSRIHCLDEPYSVVG